MLLLWRLAVIIAAAVSAGLNGFLLARTVRLIRQGRPLAHVWVWPLAALLTNVGTIYWRFHDQFFFHRGFNIGDLTAIAPSVGFLLAALLTMDRLSRYEVHGE